ncbi:MAG: beta-lactamase family protein [Gemmataceae bacterium]|nr:beta-lactamase family protein [Gemmataceae bacterium]
MILIAMLASLSLGADTSLPRSSPEQQGISSEAIVEFLETADRSIDQLHSFMLVRHGHVVAEAWWAPYDAAAPHVLFSLSKSFTSTAVGLAVAEGRFSIYDPVLKFFPEDAPAEPSANLRSMRVVDLLRMNTGQQSEPALWRGTMENNQESWEKRFLSHPVPFKPGTHFLYNSAASYMLSAIVQKVTGQTMLDYLRSRLFDPLGFDDPKWLASPRGVTNGGFGLLARTEEIARFGQLYLNKGRFGSRQILSEEWVKSATSLQTSNGSNPESDWDQGYGYQFWRCRHNAYRGDGAFGQYCIILPEHEAVVVMTGGLANMQAPLNLVWAKLLPAMKSAALPENDQALRRLRERSRSLVVRLPEGKEQSARAKEIAEKTYHFSENDQGVQKLTFDATSNPPKLIVVTKDGEFTTQVGVGRWIHQEQSFTNGVEKLAGVPEKPKIAAAGAWKSDDEFTLKLVATETPFASTMQFKFEGNRVTINSAWNVGFGPTAQRPLVGEVRMPPADKPGR